MSVRIAPSVLSADFSALGNDVRMVAAAGADWIHVDVMDGRFVPNISIGIPVVAALARISPLPLDVHLMIVEPETYVDAFVEAGAASVSVHVEATDHLHRLVHRIRQAGARPGVAINPATPLDTLADIAPDLDIVILMSVNPGFGGQTFIERSLRPAPSTARSAGSHRLRGDHHGRRRGRPGPRRGRGRGRRRRPGGRRGRVCRA